MSTYNILYQSDDNYAVFMGVSICSLLENNKKAEEINIYVIDDAISAGRKSELMQMAEEYERQLFFISPDSILEDRDIASAFSYTGMRKNTHSYLKLFADRLMPEVCGRLLYIDCDTAITGNIEELFDIDMGTYAIGMVLDSLVMDSRCSVGMRENDNYYNSGVILLDLDRWRERNYAQRIIDHVKYGRVYGTVDQDILNMEFLQEIYTLPISYNLQPIHLVYPYKTYSAVYKHKEKYYTEQEIAEAVEKPKIVHYLRYIGESPWNEGNVHPGTIYFDRYLSMSLWKNYKKEKKKNTWIFRIEKVMYKLIPRKVFLRIFYRVHERMIEKSNRIPSVATK